ncbi:DUF4913 domain-containing protein [Kitasatospora sp. NPDC001660]
MSGPTLESLAEDIADLQAHRDGFAAELQLHKDLLDELRELPPEEPATDDESGQDGGEPAEDTGQSNKRGKGQEKEEKAPVPPFILRLDGDPYALELAALAHWVANVLVPVYMREPGSLAPWCPRWWEHEEAVARLHGLWLAWQELTDPETGGRLGPSVWHRDHLDPAVAQLRDSAGPFAACMVTPNKAQHRTLPAPLLDPFPYALPVPAGADGEPAGVAPVPLPAFPAPGSGS